MNKFNFTANNMPAAAAVCAFSASLCFRLFIPASAPVCELFYAGAAICGAAAAESGKNIRPRLGLLRAEKRDIFLYPSLTLVLCVIIALFALRLPDTDTPPVIAAAGFFTAVILAPVCEELLFRGLILHSLPRYAVFLSALSFAVFHTSLIKLPFLFASGLLFSFAGRKSVYPAILSHAVINTVAFILSGL